MLPRRTDQAPSKRTMVTGCTGHNAVIPGARAPAPRTDPPASPRAPTRPVRSGRAACRSAPGAGTPSHRRSAASCRLSRHQCRHPGDFRITRAFDRPTRGMMDPTHRCRRCCRRRGSRRNAHRQKAPAVGSFSPAPPVNHSFTNQRPLDPSPLVETQLLFPAVPRKADAQPLRLLQMSQTCSLPFAQGFKVPIRHRALHVSGNNAAWKASPGQITAESTGLPDFQLPTSF
jgi:hypothetical protein